MMTPVPPPPGAPKPPPPVAPKPPVPGAPSGAATSGAPADRAASAMVNRNQQMRETIMANMPKPPPGGWTTAKIIAVCDAVNAALDAIGDKQNRCVWVAPKGMPKWAQPFPAEVYMKALLLLAVLKSMAGPQDIAALHATPEMFADDAGLDAVAKILQSLAKNKKLIAALHDAATKMAGSSPNAAEEAGEKPGAPDELVEPEDASLAGSPPVSPPFRP